jgi:hypothetical protein
LKFWSALTVTVGLAALTAGCASVTSVQDANANPDAFLAKRFTLAEVNTSVMNTIKASGTPGPMTFKEATFKLDHSYRQFGAQVDSVSHPEVSFRPLGNGFFQEIRTLENNGFQVGKTFVLTYLGALSLKRESAYLADARLIPYQEVKNIKTFKWLPSNYAPGSKLVLDYEIGNPPQLFNLRPGKVECAVDKVVKAAELNAKIKGNAVWMACNSTTDTGKASRSRVAYFENYGIGLSMEFSSSDLVSSEKIADFIEK